MCDAMNRDIMNVIFGGMSVAPPKKAPKSRTLKMEGHQNDGDQILRNTLADTFSLPVFCPNA